MAGQPRIRLDGMHFDLTTLRLIEATAELGALTKAAERIHLAPAAASRRIQDFEAQFGLALFERLPHGMTLTDAGRALVVHVRSMIHTAGRMQDDAAAFNSGKLGVVRIAGCTSAVLQFLARDIRLCQDAYPGIKIDLQELNSQGVIEVMTRGLADIGIYESTLGGVSLPTRPYRQDRLVLVVHRRHPLAGHDIVTLDDILPYDVIGLSEGAAVTLGLMRLASVASRVLHMRILVRSFQSMAAMIGEEMGIGLMPDRIAAVLAGGPQFRAIAIDGPWATRRFILCHQPGHTLSSSGRTVVEALCQSDSQIANPASAK